jgi:hypothetical protein
MAKVVFDDPYEPYDKNMVWVMQNDIEKIITPLKCPNNDVGEISIKLGTIDAHYYGKITAFCCPAFVREAKKHLPPFVE